MSLSARLGVILALVATAFAASAATAPASAAEWVDGAYAMTFTTFTEVEAAGAVDIRRMTLSGERYDADELRDAYRALVAVRGQAAGETFLRSVEGVVADSFERNLQGAFPGSAVAAPVATLDRRSLDAPTEGAAGDPPVRIALASHVDVDLAGFGFTGVDGDDVLTLLEVGARIDLPLTFFADPGHVNAFSVEFPAGIHALGGDGPVLSSVDNLAGATPRTVARDVTLVSDEAPEARPTEGRIDVVVDIRDIDVSLAGAAGGDFGTMLIDVSGTAELSNVALVGAIEDLPASVRLDSISADGVRRLVASGLVGADDLESAADDIVATVGARMREGLGSEPVGLEGRFVVAASDAPGAPVRFEVHATLTRPVAGAEAGHGAAVALYTVTQSLPFDRLEGLDTVYHVVLPRGLAATSVTTDGGEATTTTREDGRDVVALALVGDDAPERATMDVQIAVTPTFVFLKFWPLVLVAALLVALVVGSAGWAVVRAMRKK